MKTLHQLILALCVCARHLLATPLLVRHRPQRLIALNEAQRETALALNDAPMTKEGEWKIISRYGLYPNKVGKQRVNKTAADKMVAAFNDARTAQGDAWRGLPIGVRHVWDDPSATPEPVYGSARIGAVMDLEARADGLYGRVAWNDLGEKNMNEGHFLYPSPVWYFEKQKDGTIVPDELVNIGMTNAANMRDLPAWNEEPSAAELKAMALNEAITIITKEGGMCCDEPKVRTLRDKMWLAADATPEQVLAAIETRMAELDAAKARLAETEADIAAMKQQLATEQAKSTAANEALATERTAHRDTLITAAITAGILTRGDVPAMNEAFDADFTKAANELAKRPKALNTSPIAIEIKGSKRSIATNEERRGEYLKAVNERIAADRISYDEAAIRVKRDPNYSTLIKALGL